MNTLPDYVREELDRVAMKKIFLINGKPATKYALINLLLSTQKTTIQGEASSIHGFVTGIELEDGSHSSFNVTVSTDVGKKATIWIKTID